MNKFALAFRAKVCNSTSSAIELGKKTGDFDLAERILKIKQQSNNVKLLRAQLFSLPRAKKKLENKENDYQRFYKHHDTGRYGVSENQREAWVRVDIAKDNVEKARAKVTKYGVRQAQLNSKAKELSEAQQEV